MTARFRPDQPASWIYPPVHGAHWQQGDHLFDGAKQYLRPAVHLVPVDAPPEREPEPDHQVGEPMPAQVILPDSPPARLEAAPEPAAPVSEPLSSDDPDAPDADSLVQLKDVPWAELLVAAKALGLPAEVKSRDAVTAWMIDQGVTALARA